MRVKVAMEFNYFYVNIVKKNIGIKSNVLRTSNECTNKNYIQKVIIQFYENRPSNMQVRNEINNQDAKVFSFKS